MSECIFCKILKKQIPTDFIYEDDKIVVFKDIRPKARVHLLIVAKKHIQSLAHLSEKSETDSALIVHMLLALAPLAIEQGLDHGFRTVINTGTGGGQEIDHLHFHLLGGKPLPEM